MDAFALFEGIHVNYGPPGRLTYAEKLRLA